MSNLASVVDDLIAANRILASQGVVDAFGHVSARHPTDASRFFLTWAKPPELVEREDIAELTLDAVPVEPKGKPPLERFIHGALYEARGDVRCVVHSHSPNVIPFGITEERIRPVVHSAAMIGCAVPVWDSQTNFGDTDLLVSDISKGRDLACAIGSGTCVLMRGHGCTVVGRSIREAVYTAVYLEVNARLQLKAGSHEKIKFLTPGEVEKACSRLLRGKPGEGFDRAWQYWCCRAKVAFERP